MSAILDGWVDTTLGNVLAEGLSNGRSVPTAESGFPVLRLTALVNGRIDLSERKMGQWSREEAQKYFVRSGDFLISRGNGSIRLVGRGGLVPHDDEVAFPDTMIRARPATNALNPQFLRYQWESHAVRRQIEKAAKTTAGIYKVSQGDLLSVALVLAPLPEQHRIVAEIEKHLTRLDAAVATLERVQAELKRARASVLKAAVEGRLVPTEAELARAEGRTYEHASVLLERILEERKRGHEESQGKKKYKPPVGPETQGLLDLPGGWVWATLDQTLENHDFARIPIKQEDRATRRGNIPYYGASGIIDIIDSYTHEGSYLLVGEDGANLLARSKPIAFQAHGQFWVNNHAHVLLPYGNMPLGYFESHINGMNISKYITGSAQPKLPQGAMIKIPLAIPPLAEQHRIVAEVERRLSVFDALATTVTRNLARCAALRQSILKRAFSGKLVPQDPTDEPASALLDRIRSSAVP